MPSTPLEITAQWKDIEKPVITGIEDGKTYCSAQTVTVSDNDGIASVTVNDVAVVLANNQFTLSPATGTQEIIATDNAGNSKTVTVTVNSNHNLKKRSLSPVVNPLFVLPYISIFFSIKD